MATTKVRVKKEDPQTPTPQQLASANAFAKDFATRKNLLIAQDAHVGNAIPKFIDSRTGMETTGASRLPPRTITDIKMIPSYVKSFQFDNGVPYYKDEDSGDIQYVHPDIARSPRFNPNRGAYGNSIMSYAKK